MLSPEYSARKHHVPTAEGVKPEDVAVAVLPAPAFTDTAVPTAVPPLAQPEALVNGPHTKKLTDPGGLPPALFPVTVALSVFGSPSVIAPFCGLELVAVDAFATVKHSVGEPSLELV